MGIPGKRRRLRNFDKNAENAAKAMAQEKGHKWINRIGRKFRVAMGTKSRRMILKSSGEVAATLAHQKWLVEQIGTGKIKPKTFTLEEFHAFIPEKEITTLDKPFGTGIQQYYDKPTLYNLVAYLELKANGHTDFELSKEEYFLAKKFMRRTKNKGITSDQLYKVNAELSKIAIKNSQLAAFKYIPWGTNTIIQGVNKDGTLRVTIIDI
jgi:hypothetical protein